MKELSISVVTGDITDQKVDLLVNSSNTYLLLGSGSAEQIRDACGYLNVNDKYYWDLVDESGPVLRKVLDHIHSKRHVPSAVQKECLEYVIRENKSNEFALGDSVLTTSCNLSNIPGRAKYVAHAIGMTYNWAIQPNPPIVPATFDSVKKSLIKSFDFADKLKCKSVAMPVMCTRKGGLSKEDSSNATSEALKRLEGTGVNKLVVVLYSDDLMRDAEWYEEFYKS